MTVESSFIKHSVSPPKYKQLLIAIVLRFLIIPFVHGGIGGVIASFLFFHITFLIIQSYQLKRSRFRLLVAIATAGFLLDIMLTLNWIPHAIALTLAVPIMYGIFFGSAALLILQRIIQASRVTMDTIRGGVCVYLLLGYFGALLYAIVYTLDASSFSSELWVHPSYAMSNHAYSPKISSELGFEQFTPTHQAHGCI